MIQIFVSTFVVLDIIYVFFFKLKSENVTRYTKTVNLLKSSFIFWLFIF